MADHTKPRTWRGLALILTMALLLVTGCQSSKDSGSSHGSGDAPAAVTSGPKTTTANSTGSASSEKLCGTPPCVRFMSRGDTKNLSETLTDHPIASTVALHLAL